MLVRRLLINLRQQRYYRPAAFSKPDRATYTSDFLKTSLEQASFQSQEDWKKLRQYILDNADPRSQITANTVDAMTVSALTALEKYELAVKYYEYAQKVNSKPSLAMMGKYLRAIYMKCTTSAMSDEDKDKILTTYDQVKIAYPVLDSLTLDQLIQAISLTHKWKESVDLINAIKLTNRVPPSAYSALVAAAFRNNDDDLGWKIMDEMMESDIVPLATVYVNYFDRIKSNNDRQKAINTMFEYLQKCQLKLPNHNSELIVKSLKQCGCNVRMVPSPNPKNICSNCSHELQKFEITQEEFEILKNRILKNVIIGKDVFIKTTPEELSQFKKFVSNMGHFDVVVDGLNVAYAKGNTTPFVRSELVLAVVNHFHKRGKKVLLLGRHHMTKWPKMNWNQITEKATVFLTQDLSHDDPYLLYCAVTLGSNTIIVSRDLMRSHKALLKNLQEKLSFQRWLSQRQYILIRINQNGLPVFNYPLSYSYVAQRSGDIWHVPVEPANQMEIVKWLCITT